MTIEEKAKAYDEVIERAKPLYEQAKKDGSPIWSTYEYLIPELVESEDEKIRGCIGIILTDAAEQRFTDFGVSLKDCLAWLDRQNEQIPYIDFVIKPHNGDDDNPYDMSVSEAQEYAIKRGFGIPSNDDEVYVDERHMTQTIGNIIRWADEHPKEQKSINEYVSSNFDNIWEEDCEELISEGEKLTPKFKELLKEVCHAWYDRGLQEQKESADGKALLYTANKSYEIGYRDGKIDTQKPIELSEEDEDTYNRVYCLFRDAIDEWYKAVFSGCYPKITRDKVLAMLESLHTQSKQEYSEEDKEMLNTIIGDVSRTLHSCGIGTDEHRIRSRAIKFLKSLRLQHKQEWTDDDEQHLKWLCRIIHSRKNHGELSLAEESELGNWIDKWINHNP